MDDSQLTAKASRQKYFSEMDVNEKIEKLKEELHRTQCQIELLGKTLTDLLTHDHLNGKPVKRIPNPQEESGGGFWFRVEDFNRQLR